MGQTKELYLTSLGQKTGRKKLRNSTNLPGIAQQGWLQETFNCLPMQGFISKLAISTVCIYKFLLLNINKLTDWIHAIQPHSQALTATARNAFEKLRSKIEYLHF